MLKEKPDRELIDAAITLAKSRFPTENACVAALKTSTGRVLTSVCFGNYPCCKFRASIATADALNLQHDI
jgi:hypothetical protein